MGLSLLALLGLSLTGYIIVSNRLTLRRFRRKYDGSFFIVCSMRRGWFDFARNNIAPSGLAELAFQQRSGGSSELLFNALFIRGVNEQKPYLARVVGSRIYAISLFESLLPFKNRAARDEAVQNEVAGLIADAKQQLERRI